MHSSELTPLQPLFSEFVDGEVRFDLPVRPLPHLRVIAIVLIAFSLVFLWGPAAMLVGTVIDWPQDPQPADVLFALFELAFVVAGAVPMLLGVLMLLGHCRVSWRPGELRSAEILGPFHWTRRLPREPLSRLLVTARSQGNRAVGRNAFEEFSVLVAEYASGTKSVLALGYPQPLLMQLAEQLRRYIGSDVGNAGGADVEVIAPGHEADVDQAEQPASSRVRIETHGSTVTLHVPPAGLRRGSRGLFAMSIVWCGIIASITAGFAFMDTNGPLDRPWFVAGILGLFWLVGLCLLLAAINMGRRTAQITVDRDRLGVHTAGLFGARQYRWSREEIAAVRVDGSGMAVKDVPVLELQIHPRTGGKIGLLAGRADDELRWLASVLRTTLDVPARSGLA